MKHVLFILLFSFTLSDVAVSAIPSTRTILNRAARTTGHGLYQIDQDVIFRTEVEPITLHERWLIDNGDTLRLTVSAVKGSSDGWAFEALYKDGRRVAREAAGPTTSPYSPEFFEPYLHFRSGKNMLEAMIRQRLLPANLQARQRRIKLPDGGSVLSETFVRLARTGGVIAYAFGEPTPPKATRANPGVWIEQDAFLLRRLRFPSEAEVQANRFIEAARGIQLPKERTVSWNNHSVVIRVQSVRALASGPATQKQFMPASMSAAQAINLPSLEQVREFYARFR